MVYHSTCALACATSVWLLKESSLQVTIKPRIVAYWYIIEASIDVYHNGSRTVQTINAPRNAGHRNTHRGLFVPHPREKDAQKHILPYSDEIAEFALLLWSAHESIRVSCSPGRCDYCCKLVARKRTTLPIGVMASRKEHLGR
jgi:hypothetical protein